MKAQGRLSVSGNYAGPVSRAAAAALDALMIMGLYTLGVAGVGLLASVFFGSKPSGDWSAPVAFVALGSWAFVYAFASQAIAGRTPGKAITGLRLVSREGAVPSTGTVFVRTLAFPLSVLFFGLGFVPVVLGREHRALHDMIAGTAVVYDWGDRSAEMPGPLSEFLQRVDPQV